ncbi:acyl-CoA carboxylase subunit epsilon [Kitasatospora sp. NPDC048407]|uniref:acyl-CoA carboxylase subunit epsilon n=1 Tax=Kitasatospora sp. NPDC048407 TaxID=3364051 RepID=UPI00371A6DC8
MTTQPSDVLRIEKGMPTDEELAAVTVALLLATSRAADPAGTATLARARWRRVDRTFGHRTPRSWRSEASHLARTFGEAA